MNYKNVKEAAYEMIHEVEERSEIFDVFCQYTKIFLALNSVRLLCISQEYHDKYLNDIRFDNMYITTYFVHIDERRKLNGHYFLLPFRKNELEKLIYPHSIFLTKIERNFVVMEVIKLIIRTILGCLFFVADWSLYTMMLMIKKQGLIEYTQTGHSDMEIIIKGSGLISRILRSLLNGFNFKKKVNVILSNKGAHYNDRVEIIQWFTKYNKKNVVNDKLYNSYFVPITTNLWTRKEK
ncbi:protein sneaky-like [Lycorma delicatula]|uniref:protein sneaky-like n=1 Tax=Lycorma delicatula TaxID=130591 RepID=UPI003F510857